MLLDFPAPDPADQPTDRVSHDELARSLATNQDTAAAQQRDDDNLARLAEDLRQAAIPPEVL